MIALPDESTLARYVIVGLALAAVAWGIWEFLRREPPRREAAWAPARDD